MINKQQGFHSSSLRPIRCLNTRIININYQVHSVPSVDFSHSFKTCRHIVPINPQNFTLLVAGNLISSLSLFTVKSVPSTCPAGWLNTGVNGSNAIISSGNLSCFKNKAQWSDCGAEFWCRKKFPSSIFTFFLDRQAPGQIVTSHTACFGVVWTWWRTTRSTEQALKGSLLLAPSGGGVITHFWAISGAQVSTNTD